MKEAMEFLKEFCELPLSVNDDMDTIARWHVEDLIALKLKVEKWWLETARRFWNV